MIEHNSEVYNQPYITFFIVHVYIWKKISVGVIVYFTVMFDHPSCFLTFCRSGIPTSCYIFNVFYYLYNIVKLKRWGQMLRTIGNSWKKQPKQ